MWKKTVDFFSGHGVVYYYYYYSYNGEVAWMLVAAAVVRTESTELSPGTGSGQERSSQGSAGCHRKQTGSYNNIYACLKQRQTVQRRNGKSD